MKCAKVVIKYEIWDVIKQKKNPVLLAATSINKKNNSSRGWEEYLATGCKRILKSLIYF